VSGAPKVGTLVVQVAEGLVARGWTLATAESCTGGWVGKMLTDRPGASAFYVGGVVAYADAVKLAQLGLEAEDLRAHGAVSESTARGMAVRVAERFSANVGVSVTGIAGPEGGSEAKPVGTVWMGLSLPGKVTVERAHFPGSRKGIRRAASHAVIRMVAQALGHETHS